MKKVLLSTLIASTLGMAAGSAFAADDVELRMSWWGGNGRHQVTLKAVEEFQKEHPNIKVKSEYTG